MRTRNWTVRRSCTGGFCDRWAPRRGRRFLGWPGRPGPVVTRLEDGRDFAVAVALHRAANCPEGALVSYVQARCRLPVLEAEDKDAIEPGRVYLAPADYHLLGQIAKLLNELGRIR